MIVDNYTKDFMEYICGGLPAFCGVAVFLSKKALLLGNPFV